MGGLGAGARVRGCRNLLLCNIAEDICRAGVEEATIYPPPPHDGQFNRAVMAVVVMVLDRGGLHLETRRRVLRYQMEALAFRQGGGEICRHVECMIDSVWTV